MCLAVGVVAVVCASTNAIADKDTVFLRYDYKQGDSAVYELKIGYQLDVWDRVYKRFLECEVTELCLQVQGGTHVMKMMFGEVDVTMTWGADPFGVIRNLSGKSVIFTLGRNGIVKDIRTEGTIPGWSHIKVMVIRIIRQWYAYLPVRECEKGEKWSVERADTTGNIICTEEQAYKFEGIKRKKRASQDDLVLAKVVEEFGVECAAPPRVHPDYEKVDGKTEFHFDPESMKLVKIKVSYDLTNRWYETERGDIPADFNYSFNAKRK
jgi:hypothetical protein